MKSLRILASLLVLYLHVSVHLTLGHGQETGSGDPFSEADCDISRGCFLCLDGCGANVAWSPDPEEQVIRFSMWGPVQASDTGYVAMGISENNVMAASDVYACIVDGGTGSFKRYWTPASGRRVDDVPQKGFSDEGVSLVNGEIRCQFTRNMSLNDGDAQFYDVSSLEFFLLLASGPVTGGAVGYHTMRGGTEGALDLSKTVSAQSGAEPGLPLMKAHGCLMIIAWLGLASIGMTLARYYKPMWPSSKLCGVKIWFALHRACMVTAVLLVIIAFIIIFIHVNGIIGLEGTSADSKRRFAHTILGIIVTFLGILNPIMAIFRPHPGTTNRPKFNWAHWGVGTGALILAMVTIGLALGELGGVTIIPGMEAYLAWVLVAFIVFHVFTWILLDVLKCFTDSEGRTDDIPLGGKGDSPPPAAEESPAGSVLKNILLFIYVLGVIFVVAFLVISIAIV